VANQIPTIIEVHRPTSHYCHKQQQQQQQQQLLLLLMFASV